MRTTPNALDLLNMLSPQGREIIERETVALHLPAGRDLFHQGDPGDAFYVVVAGSLGIYVKSPPSDQRLIAVVGEGEAVGELALISGQPRSATVTAIRDSELLRIAKSRFDFLLRKHPDLMSGLMRILVHRLRRLSMGHSTSIEPHTAAFLPAQDGVETREVAERLAQCLKRQGSTVAVVGTEGLEESPQWFSELERNHDYVFLHGTADEAAWTRICARQADRIMIVAGADWTGATSLPDDLLKQRAQHQLLDLVILHPAGTESPHKTDLKIDAVPANRYFHVRPYRDDDWERLSRIIRGRGIGLVLSGGGARAFAHVGVIRAMADAGIPIDFIGGTSMGGIVAAGVAMEWSPDELTERINGAFVQKNPLSDITLPLLGMVKGKRVERLLEEHYGDRTIPDLWLPYYCVSSNLTSGAVHVHSRGRIREALRASIALPGILPPKAFEEALLVDGAVTSNLPIDIMRNLHSGPIIAVDVARARAVGPELIEEYHNTPWYRRVLHPPIVSILMRSATISSEAQDRQQAANADLLLTPPLDGIEIRDWKAFDRTVEIGYEYAAAKLDAFKKRMHNRQFGAFSV
jgi:NTE family protein